VIVKGILAIGTVIEATRPSSSIKNDEIILYFVLFTDWLSGPLAQKYSTNAHLNAPISGWITVKRKLGW
jgi:hypothetical protein